MGLRLDVVPHSVVHESRGPIGLRVAIQISSARKLVSLLSYFLANFIIFQMASTRADIEIQQYHHSAFAQYSIIATFYPPGAGSRKISAHGKSRPPLVTTLLTTHLDSTVSREAPGSALAPGVDDNASGCATLVEAFRVLVELQYQVAEGKSLEMHWYAGEEGGLLGSFEVAKEYQMNGVGVQGVVNFDQTA